MNRVKVKTMSVPTMVQITFMVKVRVILSFVLGLFLKLG